MNNAFLDLTSCQFVSPLINDQQHNNKVTKRNICINYNYLALLRSVIEKWDILACLSKIPFL